MQTSKSLSFQANVYNLTLGGCSKDASYMCLAVSLSDSMYFKKNDMYNGNVMVNMVCKRIVTSRRGHRCTKFSILLTGGRSENLKMNIS